MRESSVRGPAVDLSEFERRVRSADQSAAPKPDPLRELARLAGENRADPYSGILPDPRAARQTPPPLPQAPAWDGNLRGSYEAAPPVAADAPYYEDDYQAVDHHAPQQGHAVYPEQGHAAYPEQGYADQTHAHQTHAQQPYDQPYHGGAEGGWGDDSQYLDYGDEGEAEAPDGGIRRYLKPWHAAVAIGVIAVGSIAWGFLHRSGAGGSKEIAVINAPEGPVKVKPTAETDQDAPPNNGAAVLDRRDATPVKQVVTNQEQSVDPAVSSKAVTLGDGPVDAPHEATLGANPRKVKTVTVRPDGSRVEDAAVPPAAVESAEPLFADPPQSKGATPRPETRPATTAQAAKPKPAPKPKVAAVEPPAEDDAAAPPATTGASTPGGFAVQFGAAGSEEEARTLLQSVSAKYGVKATFKPAKVGDKMVYRVRAAGLSKDSANAVCNKVKASGGNCFVAGN